MGISSEKTRDTMSGKGGVDEPLTPDEEEEGREIMISSNDNEDALTTKFQLPESVYTQSMLAPHLLFDTEQMEDLPFIGFLMFFLMNLLPQYVLLVANLVIQGWFILFLRKDEELDMPTTCDSDPFLRLIANALFCCAMLNEFYETNQMLWFVLTLRTCPRHEGLKAKEV